MGHTMYLKNQQQKKLKLLVKHGRVQSPCFSILSTEEYDDDKSLIMSSFPAPDLFDPPVASCHELLLAPTGAWLKNGKLSLWDPTTNDLKTLPPPPRPPPSTNYYMCVGFNGLGLDPKTRDDYKVIRFVEFEFGDYGDCCRGFFSQNQAELYSLKTNSWKLIPYPHADDILPLVEDSIYINGFTYWSACTGADGEDLVIFSFDFANESFPSALIPRPNEAYKIVRQNRYCFLLAEFEGSLALLVHDKHEKQLVLWVWNKEDVSWSRKQQVWTVDDVFKPLAFLKNHLFYFEDSKFKLVLFDCAKQKLKKFHGVKCGRCNSLITLPFVGRGV